MTKACQAWKDAYYQSEICAKRENDLVVKLQIENASLKAKLETLKVPVEEKTKND